MFWFLVTRLAHFYTFSVISLENTLRKRKWNLTSVKRKQATRSHFLRIKSFASTSAKTHGGRPVKLMKTFLPFIYGSSFEKKIVSASYTEFPTYQRVLR